MSFENIVFEYWIYSSLAKNGLTLSQTSPCFKCLQNGSFENTMEKGEIAHDEQFLLFQQWFLSFLKNYCHTYCPVQNLSLEGSKISRLKKRKNPAVFSTFFENFLQNLQSWKRLKFVVWKRGLTLSCIYRSTHFNALKKKKKLQENIVEIGEIAQNEQFHLFPQCFLCNLYLKIL